MKRITVLSVAMILMATNLFAQSSKPNPDRAFVDLGTGVLWATMNVGAGSVTELGDYYAWGDVEERRIFNKSICELYDEELDEIGGGEYDVARTLWGEGWRLPTRNEVMTLKMKCKWTWVKDGDVWGYIVESEETGQSMFLPVGGYYYGAKKYDECEGYYWTASADDGITEGGVLSTAIYDAQCLYMSEIDRYLMRRDRYYGMLIRPVFDNSVEEVEEVVDMKKPSAMIGNYRAVNLGLSVMWADTDLGAHSETEFGDYYCWGDIVTEDKSPYKKDMFLTKGCGEFSGNPQFDAATAERGARWRVPTYEEFEELKYDCDWEWTTVNGVEGYKVTSRKTNQSIFLPASNSGSGRYWTSTPAGSSRSARVFKYSDGSIYVTDDYCYRALRIRPVADYK